MSECVRLEGRKEGRKKEGEEEEEEEEEEKEGKREGREIQGKRIGRTEYYINYIHICIVKGKEWLTIAYVNRFHVGNPHQIDPLVHCTHCNFSFNTSCIYNCKMIHKYTHHK